MLLRTSKARWVASIVSRTDLIAFSGCGSGRVSQLRPAEALSDAAVSEGPTSCAMAAATASMDIMRASRSRLRAAVARAKRI